MNQRHRYSKEQIQFLRDNVKGITLKQLTERFNKCFGTNLSEHAIAMQKAKYGFKSGIVGGRFEKGSIPHNKGKKMPRKQYSACSKTMFKPGNKPKNTDPIGTEKLLSDGYVWVKVNDKPKVPKKENWKQKHKLLWEQEYGSVPDGSVVIFKDGDSTHIELDNLECVTRSQLLILNKKKLIHSNKQISETGIAVAKLIDAVNKKKNAKKC